MLALLIGYMGVAVTVEAISHENWGMGGAILVLGVIAVGSLYYGWQGNGRPHVLNRWRYPAVTTRGGIWLRAMGTWAGVAVLVAIAIVLWSGFEHLSFRANYGVRVAAILLGLSLPLSYWSLRRRYALVPGDDNALRYVGPKKVNLWVRLLIAISVALAVGIGFLTG